MNMTCERFRSNLDLYIDSELPVEERRAMEEHALSCEACAALLDQALTLATVCAEMNEGLLVPADARAAWRRAIHQEVEAKAVPRRQTRRGHHRGKAAEPRGAFSLTRALYVVAAVLILCVALGPMLSNLDVSDLLDDAKYGVSDVVTTRSYEEDYGSAAFSSVSSTSGAMGYSASIKTGSGSTFRLESDGEVSNSRLVSSDKSDSGIVVLRSATRKAKTKTFDDASAWLDDLLREYDAYFEQCRINGQAESKNRTLNATIRVPSASLDDFLVALDQVGTITMREELAEDITANYSDVSTRLSVLRSQLDQLNAMNEVADSVADLIEIHERATELMSDIESYESCLRSWDSRRNYSAVTLSLTETADVIETPETTLGERMRNAFNDSMEWLREFGQDLAVFGANLLPKLVVIIPTLIIVILLLKLAFRKKKK